MCRNCLLAPLDKQVAVTLDVLNREANIPEALRRLTIIHTDMVAAVGPNDPKVIALENDMAQMQPYLIEPNFMAGDANG